MSRSSLHRYRAHAYAALLLSAAVPGLVTAARAQAPAKPKQAQQQRVTLGDTIVTADQLDYDLEKKQYIFSSSRRVELVSRGSRMTAGKMIVQMTGDNEVRSVRCEGDVQIERKDPDDGTVMTGRGDALEYSETAQQANLTGNVTVQQDSARLAKPLVVTGSKIEMDLKNQKNVVHRSPQAQAKAQVQPKGKDEKDQPEPVELHADKIELNGRTQEYVATGSPKMIRPSSQLQAKVIRFQVDEKTNDVKTAKAEGGVIFDNRSEKGSTLHATGDNGTFDREEGMLVLTGSVNAQVKDPSEERPTVYQCDTFQYNTRTGARTMKGNVVVTLPERKPKPAEKVEAAVGAAKKADSGK